MGSEPHDHDEDLFGRKDFAPRDLSEMELAKLFGVSDRTIRELVERKVIAKTARRTYNLRACVLGYTAHLREIAAARGNGAGGGSLTQAREHAMREKAEQLALRNAQTRGELIPAAEIEAAWLDITGRIRARMLAVPSRVQQQLPHMTATDVAALDREIRDGLAELAHADAPP